MAEVVIQVWEMQGVDVAQAISMGDIAQDCAGLYFIQTGIVAITNLTS